MNRIRNKKFFNIVEILKKTNNNRQNYLKSIQLLENYSLIFPSKKFYNRSLLNLFNEDDKINRLANKTNRNDLTSNKHHKKEFNNISNDIDNITNNTTNKVNITYLNQLKNTDSSIKLIYSLKKRDYFSDIFFKSIDPLYATLDYNEKKEYIKNKKLKIIDIFNKQAFYKKYDYSTKDFKKSDLDHYFTSNLPITLNMTKVYCDVFSVNFVYKNTLNTNRFMNRFNKNRATFILYEAYDKVYGIKNKDSYIRGSLLENFLKFNKKPIKEILEKMKISEIQNVAKMLNITTKKQGKVSKINKVKSDLINEILI